MTCLWQSPCTPSDLLVPKCSGSEMLLAHVYKIVTSRFISQS